MTGRTRRRCALIHQGRIVLALQELPLLVTVTLPAGIRLRLVVQCAGRVVHRENASMSPVH